MLYFYVVIGILLIAWMGGGFSRYMDTNENDLERMSFSEVVGFFLRMGPLFWVIYSVYLLCRICWWVIKTLCKCVFLGGFGSIVIATDMSKAITKALKRNLW